jgi:DNA gyrase subunit A
MSVIEEGTDPDVFVVFESGMAKRSKASQWNVKGRAILGVTVAKQTEKGGDLIGALTVDEDDEVMVVFERGNIVRSRVDEVRLTGRNTGGVWFAKPGKKDAIVGVARNAEKAVEEEVAEADAEGVSPVDGTPVEDASDTSASSGAESDSGANDGVPSVDESTDGDTADGVQADGGDE